VVTKKGDIDNIALRVELLPGHEAEIEAVREKLTRELRIKTVLGYALEFCRYGSLPRYETKAKRFKDLRK
jgi:phenylacetate-CoA ligase